VEVLRGVRAELGADVGLAADANGSYDLDGARRLFDAIDDLGLQCVEQPCPADAIDEHAALVAEVRTPICLDEPVTSAGAAQQLIARRACDALAVKVGRLGISGAGLAFGLYYSAAMLFLLRYMASGRSGLTFHMVRLRAALFADILKVGVPTAVNAMLTNLTVILVTGAVGLFGTSALAGYGISSRLDYIMIPLLFGVSTATLTMVGVNMGAGQTARAVKIGWTSASMAFSLPAPSASSLQYFRPPGCVSLAMMRKSCAKAPPTCAW